MKRKLLCLFIIIISLQPLMTISVLADTGPKPSVTIRFSGIKEEIAYATLLSKTPTVAPDIIPDSSVDPFAELAFQRFAAYNDPDGFAFQRRVFNLLSGELKWSYYPPEHFKVLVYYPISDTLVFCGEGERFAFHSVFHIDLSSDCTLTPDMGEFQRQKLANLGKEALDFLARVALTLAIELSVAYLFLLREGKVIAVIIGINILTQILLNLGLYILFGGIPDPYFALLYFLLEAVIAAIESLAYCRLFPRVIINKGDPAYYVGYAICANLISFLSGIMLSTVLPIF